MTEGVLPSPRERADIVGHAHAEAILAAALENRMHHAWMITGPKGIGKATLAYRLVRKALSRAAAPALFGAAGTNDASRPLDAAPDDPIFARVAGGGHGDLMTIEPGIDPKSGRARNDILIEDIRRLNHFFSLTGAETGRRIAIVDSADSLNRNAANALLKVLEEPPAEALLILIAHQPGRVLGTIRSRCCQLSLSPLTVAEIETLIARNYPDIPADERQALSQLAEGSAGRALMLASEEGRAVYEAFADLTERLGSVPARDIHGFADHLSRRDGANRYQMFAELLRTWLAQRIRETALSEGKTGKRRLEQCLEVWDNITHLIERADAVHLDRKQVVITAFNRLQKLARA